MKVSVEIFKKQLLNSIEHALMEDEISIEKYESLVRAVNRSGDDRFTVITMDAEKQVIVLP